MEREDFQTRMDKRRAEAQQRSQDSMDQLFDVLEEGGQKVVEEYEKVKKDTLRGAFVLGLLGGLCGGTLVAGFLYYFSFS